MPGEAHEKPRRGQEAEAQEGPTDRPTWTGNVLKPFVFHVKPCRGDHSTRTRRRGGGWCDLGLDLCAFSLFFYRLNHVTQWGGGLS